MERTWYTDELQVIRKQTILCLSISWAVFGFTIGSVFLPSIYLWLQLATAIVAGLTITSSLLFTSELMSKENKKIKRLEEVMKYAVTVALMLICNILFLNHFRAVQKLECVNDHLTHQLDSRSCERFNRSEMFAYIVVLSLLFSIWIVAFTFWSVLVFQKIKKLNESAVNPTTPVEGATGNSKATSWFGKLNKRRSLLEPAFAEVATTSSTADVGTLRKIARQGIFLSLFGWILFILSASSYWIPSIGTYFQLAIQIAAVIFLFGFDRFYLKKSTKVSWFWATIALFLAIFNVIIKELDGDRRQSCNNETYEKPPGFVILVHLIFMAPSTSCFNCRLL
jgi:hypothetical protein